MPDGQARSIVTRLVGQRGLRTEADVQADIYSLLTGGELTLGIDQVTRLEVPTADGTRRRLDVEVGHCVIEVKKDLRPNGIRVDAEKQLAGYVINRVQMHSQRYVGILTDGILWRLYDLRSSQQNATQQELVEVARLELTGPADTDQLLVWLEAILATEEQIAPTPDQIEQRLGSTSPAHLLDHAELVALYRSGRSQPEVQVKRTLWTRLLRTAFGAAFRDDDDTFIDHTLLVVTAEIIAHAVVNIDVSAAGNVDPAEFVSGKAFSDAQIHGVIEADFFDWVTKVPGGKRFLRGLSDRISRFNWNHVEHDVLKHLYESVISAEARASLGEYYTPDWLADRIVADAVVDPLAQRVLDPSCGSGTFVFHAARAYLQAAEAAGNNLASTITGLTRHVMGMDVSYASCDGHGRTPCCRHACSRHLSFGYWDRTTRRPKSSRIFRPHLFG